MAIPFSHREQHSFKCLGKREDAGLTKQIVKKKQTIFQIKLSYFVSQRSLAL